MSKVTRETQWVDEIYVANSQFFPMARLDLVLYTLEKLRNVVSSATSNVETIDYAELAAIDAEKRYLQWTNPPPVPVGFEYKEAVYKEENQTGAFQSYLSWKVNENLVDILRSELKSDNQAICSGVNSRQDRSLALLLKKISVEDLTIRLTSKTYLNDEGEWIGRGNQIPVLWDVLRERSFIDKGTSVLDFGLAIRKYYKGGRGTSVGTLKSRPDYVNEGQQQAKNDFYEMLKLD